MELPLSEEDSELELLFWNMNHSAKSTSCHPFGAVALNKKAKIEIPLFIVQLGKITITVKLMYNIQEL